MQREEALGSMEAEDVKEVLSIAVVGRSIREER